MAHCNTIFHQMLKLIPRHHFGKLETEHGHRPKSPVFYPLEPDGAPTLLATHGSSQSAGRCLQPEGPEPASGCLF